MATSMHSVAGQRLRPVNLLFIALGVIATALSMAGAWQSESSPAAPSEGPAAGGTTNLAAVEHPVSSSSPALRALADPIMLQVELAQYEALGDALAMARQPAVAP